MRTDGLFTLNKYEIATRLGQPQYVIPLGDIHYDSDLHAKTEFDETLEHIRRNRKGAHMIGMGDYNDFMRAHERAIQDSVDAPSAKNALNQYAIHAVETIAKRLKPLPVRWIGLLGGNHYADITIETDWGRKQICAADAYLANMLGTRYMGVCTFITLTLRDRAAKVSHDVTIVAHHGVGAATTVGGGLNRVQRFLSGWRADIALMGDNHQRAILPTSSELSVRRGLLQSATRFIGRTGSFLRGYVDGRQSYVTDYALTPASLGIIEIELTLLRDKANGKSKVRIRGIQ